MEIHSACTFQARVGVDDFNCNPEGGLAGSIYRIMQINHGATERVQLPARVSCRKFEYFPAVVPSQTVLSSFSLWGTTRAAISGCAGTCPKIDDSNSNLRAANLNNVPLPRLRSSPRRGARRQDASRTRDRISIFSYQTRHEPSSHLHPFFLPLSPVEIARARINLDDARSCSLIPRKVLGFSGIQCKLACFE